MQEAASAWGAGGQLLTRRPSDTRSNSSKASDGYVEQYIGAIEEIAEDQPPEDDGQQTIADVLIIDETAVEDHCTSIPKSSFSSGRRTVSQRQGPCSNGAGKQRPI